MSRGELEQVEMISEKWNLNLDIVKLQNHLIENVFKKQITRQSEAFGGWSVLSSTGDYRDGWQKGHLLLDNNSTLDLKNEIKATINKRFSEYVVETDICFGYLKEVIDTIRSHGLNPYRARIICLTSGKSSVWHTDAKSSEYAVRLHIPIITNSNCYFETREEREHMPADGSGYFIYVNREHRVINDGKQDRYHLVMNVVDRNKITRFHRREDFKA